jgi:FkbM family methyltransferase
MNSRIVDKFSDDPNVIEVQSITIESFLKKIGINSIDMLKIDIEGAEIELINST